MNTQIPQLSRRDLIIASGMLAVGAGSGVWWAQRDIVEFDHHGLNLQDVKSADAALARLYKLPASSFGLAAGVTVGAPMSIRLRSLQA
ncbi:MAG: hypothetical protein JST16_14685 [Bdellovibrionales bacterium]|nr:hypothetical protein [Bdellovibrionales bacterium]